MAATLRALAWLPKLMPFTPEALRPPWRLACCSACPPELLAAEDMAHIAVKRAALLDGSSEAAPPLLCNLLSIPFPEFSSSPSALSTAARSLRTREGLRSELLASFLPPPRDAVGRFCALVTDRARRDVRYPLMAFSAVALGVALTGAETPPNGMLTGALVGDSVAEMCDGLNPVA